MKSVTVIEVEDECGTHSPMPPRPNLNLFVVGLTGTPSQVLTLSKVHIIMEGPLDKFGKCAHCEYDENRGVYSIASDC